MSKQLVENHQGTKVIFFLDPKQIVIDGVDNERDIDPYNQARIKAPLVKEDVDSVRINGVLVPVLITVRKDDKGGKEYVAEDGRQRIRRARAANEQIEKHNSGEAPIPGVPADTKLELISVPCLPAKVADDLDATLLSIAANTGRISDSPKVLAATAQYLSAKGAGFEQIATALARDTQTVRDFLNLGNASSKVLKAMDEGAIDTTAACRLAQMPKDKQNVELDRISEGGKKKVTKEAATVAAKKHKAEAKGKKAKQTEEKRSVREMRLVEKGLVDFLVNGDKRSAEHKQAAAALAMFRFAQGEDYPSEEEGVAKDLGKELHQLLMGALRQGEKIKKAEDKKKGRPAKDEE